MCPVSAPNAARRFSRRQSATTQRRPRMAGKLLCRLGERWLCAGGNQTINSPGGILPPVVHLRMALLPQMGSSGSGWMPPGLLVGMLARRLFACAFGSLAFAWVTGVPVYYALTLDQSRIVSFSRSLTDRSFLQSIVFLLVQFAVIPCGLVVGSRVLWRQIRSRAWRGVEAGLAFGMWASTVLLVVPYVGTYPSLPTASRRLFACAFGSLAFAWVTGVPVYYALTLDQSRIVSFSRSLTDRSFLQSIVFLLVQFAVIPCGLVVGSRVLWRQIRSRAWRGVEAGLAFGMWASTVLLVVPYVGTYPSLPTASFASLVTGGLRAGSAYYLSVLAANALIYPFLGALVLLSLKGPSPAGACRRCAYDLTGNVSGVCPECGTAVQQATKRDDPTTPADGG